MITHQTPEQILQTATPEQKILWNYIYLTFGDRIPISQYFYQGVIAGTEFLTYNANRLYIAYSVTFSHHAGPTAGYYQAILYNELNAIFMDVKKTAIFWDVTAAAVRYYGDTAEAKNLYFSRILASGYDKIKFIGYRISI